MAPELLEVGRVVRPHGLRGEVVVDMVSNRAERLAEGASFTATLADPGAAETTLTVRAARPFQHRHLVVFAEVHSRDDAEAIRGARLRAPAIEDPDALFVHELVGATVQEPDGTERGVVTALQANPASDLLVLDDGRYLVPLRFVVERRPGRIIVEVPAGLFE
ncbi:MAG: ribosome maturation factor RimM [Actinomycetota bacterium]|nr:ribosome maturation factor RimM [Actinomycetota bacterium]